MPSHNLPLSSTFPASHTNLTQFLSSIKVILVNTTLPANIGSTARAMHTMGLSDLVVVSPKHPIDEDAIAHAAGASEILQNATICSTLEQAIADCQWVLAASSRQRHMPTLVITPRQAVQLMLAQFSQLSQASRENTFKIALVFGREDRGLTNEELQLADYHVQIPANPAYGVLNVAAAVQVIASVFFEQASEFFMPEMRKNFSDLPYLMTPSTANATTPNALSQLSINHQPLSNGSLDNNEIHYFIRQIWDEKPITHAQQRHLQTKILTLLEQLALYNPAQPKVLPHRLTRLSHRLQLDTKEYELLQATLEKIQRKISGNIG